MSRKEKQALADKLYIASCAGDLRHILLLLSLGAPINMPSLVHELYDAFKPAKPGLLSALAGAAGNRQLGAVKLLLERGAVLNTNMKQSSSSPLHQACKADDVEMTAYLLEQGADVDALNCYKTTPLMYAVKHGAPDLVALILAYNPDLHILSFINTAAIHWAVWPGNEDVMQLMLEAGANPNHAMGDGSTPLHCAASSGLSGICALLIRYGADPRRRNEGWKTPGMVAAEQGHPDLGNWLREAEKRTTVEVRSR
jgi:ankyrin repeat protein